MKAEFLPGTPYYDLGILIYLIGISIMASFTVHSSYRFLLNASDKNEAVDDKVF